MEWQKLTFHIFSHGIKDTYFICKESISFLYCPIGILKPGLTTKQRKLWNEIPLTRGNQYEGAGIYRWARCLIEFTGNADWLQMVRNLVQNLRVHAIFGFFTFKIPFPKFSFRKAKSCNMNQILGLLYFTTS